MSTPNDVFLNVPETNPADVRLGDPTTVRSSESVATPTTVLPGVGALTLTGLAPTALTPRVMRPAVGALTITGFAPTVLTPRVMRPGVGVLTLTGLVPTIRVPRVVVPAVGALVVTGLVPTVLTPRVVRPSVGVLALAGVAPTVLTPRVARPAVGVVTLVGFAPTVVVATVSASALVLPGVGSLVLTGYEPTVTGDPTSQNGGAFGYIQRIRRSRQTVWLVAEAFAPTVVIAPTQTFRAVPAKRPAIAVAGVGALALEGYAPAVVLSAPVIAPAPEHEPDATGEPRHERPTVEGEALAGLVTAIGRRSPSQSDPIGAGIEPSVSVVALQQSEDNTTEPAAPVPAWLASPIVVDVGSATLLLNGFAPTIHVTTRTTEPEPWSPDEDDAAILWAAYDLLVNA